MFSSLVYNASTVSWLSCTPENWRDTKYLINIKRTAESRLPKARCSAIPGPCQHALPDPFLVTPGACGNFLLPLVGSTACASVVLVALGRQQVWPHCCLIWGRGCRPAGSRQKEKWDEEWASSWRWSRGFLGSANPGSSQRASVQCLLGPFPVSSLTVGQQRQF